MRRVVELHWPALLVGSVCVGLGLAIWIALPLAVVAVLSLAAIVGSAVLDGPARLAAVGVALALVGLGWGSLRMDALRRSVLASSVGESGVAELVTVAPARSSPYAIRVLAVARAFRREQLSERVLLVLPVGRSPPRGAIIEATVRVAEPRPEEDGFDERAWLARQGIHVVLESTSWRQIGRRGGIAGVGDALRDRIERAVGRGTEGVRRGIVLGVVLGEDEGLPRGVQDDFRASGLYHLLAVSGQNVAFLAAGIYGLGWLVAATEDWRELSILVAIAVVRPRGRLAAVGRARGRRGSAGVARLARRQAARPVALPGVGALVLLAWMPTSALEPGFQLSFAAVAAIFLAVPRVRDVARRLSDAARASPMRSPSHSRAVSRPRRSSCCTSAASRSTRCPRTCSRSRRRRSCSASGSSPPWSIRPRRPLQPVSLRSRAGRQPGSSWSPESSPIFPARRSARAPHWR